MRGVGENADAEFRAAIGKVAAVFGRQRRAQTTADEHKEYTRKVDLPPGTSRTPSTRWRPRTTTLAHGGPVRAVGGE